LKVFKVSLVKGGLAAFKVLLVKGDLGGSIAVSNFTHQSNSNLFDNFVGLYVGIKEIN
jgi:hypothetical protein